MPQLYAQCASRPDPWLLGRTSAGLCTLQAACPLTVTYSGGSPAADTIAAGSAATVYGGSAAAFDASADVWVVLTVPGSGTLQVVKEADLATVTGDWAGLARIVQHSTEPYQPQAYLASGGTGSAPTSTLVALVSDTLCRARSLWTGSANSAPPASWQTLAYDDSAWGLAVVGHDESVGLVPIGTGHIVWTSNPGLSLPEQSLFRGHATLPAGTITAAALRITFDATDLGLYINGTSLGTPANTGLWGYPAQPDAALIASTVAISPALLNAGGDNVLAVWVGNNPDPGDVDGGLTYELRVTYAGGAGLPDPGGTEGDLLYYHGGAWVPLPLGSSGQELTVVGSDPAWATPSGGTVTSVQVAVPAPLSASGGPVTASGTITLAWASGQSANRVLASPDGTTGAVSLRALVGNDIPVDASTIVSSAGTIKGNYQAGSGVAISGNTISATGSGGSVTSVALSMPSSVFSTAGSPVTTSGALAVSLQAQASRTFWAGPASGSSAAPTFRALQSSDLPAAAAAGGHIHAHGHFL